MIDVNNTTTPQFNSDEVKKKKKKDEEALDPSKAAETTPKENEPNKLASQRPGNNTAEQKSISESKSQVAQERGDTDAWANASNVSTPVVNAPKKPGDTKAANFAAMTVEQKKQHTANLLFDLMGDMDKTIGEIALVENNIRKRRVSSSRARREGIPSKEILAEQKAGLLEKRKNQFAAYGASSKLIKSGEADKVHLLFDAAGKPVAIDTHKEVKNSLHRDQDFENNVAQVQDSLLGLSDEEKLVKTRDFITAELRKQKDNLKLMKGIDNYLGETLKDKKTKSKDKVALHDQKIITRFSAEESLRKANQIIDYQKQLTEAINQKDYKKGLDLAEKFFDDVKSGSYAEVENKYSADDIRNQDIARTGYEDKELKAEIAAIEKEFEGYMETLGQRHEVSRAKHTNDTRHVLKNTSYSKHELENRFLTAMSQKGRENMSGYTASLKRSLGDEKKYMDEIFNTVVDARADREEAHKEYAYSSTKLEKYKEALTGIRDEAVARGVFAGRKAIVRSKNLGVDIAKAQARLQRTEWGMKFARDSALITVATGGTGLISSNLLKAGWGLKAASLASSAGGSTAGISTSVAMNNAKALGRKMNGVADPYKDFWSKTYEDGKLVTSSSVGMGTTMSVMSKLSKWNRLTAGLLGGSSGGFASTNINYGMTAAQQLANNGQVDIEAGKYFQDLAWNSISSAGGGAIGGSFSKAQQAASKNLVKWLALQGSEEGVSIVADMATALGRDGKITSDTIAESFRSSITGRVAGHFSNQKIDLNKVAQAIKNQDIEVKQVDRPDFNGKTEVEVSPSGKRKVKVELSKDIVERARNGDLEAQKIIAEETFGHGRERPIDPLVKQADGSYKAMSQGKYKALRARQELVQRAVGEAKTAKVRKESVSKAKAESKQAIKEVEKLIKEGKYEEAMTKSGLGDKYKKTFEEDYKNNANRDRKKDALKQTSYSAVIDKQAFADIQKDVLKEVENSKEPITNDEVETMIEFFEMEFTKKQQNQIEQNYKKAVKKRNEELAKSKFDTTLSRIDFDGIYGKGVDTTVVQDRIKRELADGDQRTKDAINDIVTKATNENEVRAHLDYISKFDQSLRQRVEDISSNSKLNIQEKIDLAENLTKLENVSDFETFMTNLRVIDEAGKSIVDFVDHAIRLKSEALSDGNNPNDVVVGAYAEASVYGRMLNDPNISSIEFGKRDLIKNKVIDADGNVLIQGDKVLDQSLVLEQTQSDPNYSMIKDGDNYVRVNNGEGKDLVVYNSKAKQFEVKGKPVSLVKDKKTGKLVAREIDATYHHKRYGKILTDIKADVTTAHSRYFKDSKKATRAVAQFEARIGIAKSLGITNIAYTVDRTAASVTLKQDSKDFYTIMRNLAMEQGLTLYLFDRDHNSIEF